MIAATALVAGLPLAAPVPARGAKAHKHAGKARQHRGRAHEHRARSHKHRHRHRARAHKAEVQVGDRYWEIGVDGHSYRVKAGGALQYASCTTVESITPVVNLSGVPGRENSYEVWLAGPGDTGISLATQRTFEGATTIAELPIVPLAFPDLTRSVNEAPFATGTYTLEMKLGGALSRPRPVEKLELVGRGTC